MRPVIGLTGGIGSGKSAAAEMFAELGASVVDTDAIAHRLTQAGGDAIPEIARQFGPESVDSSGAMDRRQMRELAFSDPAAKKKLESILHPMIRLESLRLIESATGPYVVHVVPLLVESPGYRDRVLRVLVVDCPRDVQIARVKARSGLSEREIVAILDAQAPREARLAAADDIIDNGGSLAALRDQVRALHERYAALAGKPANMR